MARESALWQRLRTGRTELLHRGYKVHINRIENAVTSGLPDIEGCICAPLEILGGQLWVEMKSNERPKRSTTPIHPKTRESQSIWHKARTEAGCRCHWVLIQVGSGHQSSLYLIPGSHYDDIHVPESKLAELSVVSPDASPADVLERASRGW